MGAPEKYNPPSRDRSPKESRKMIDKEADSTGNREMKSDADTPMVMDVLVVFDMEGTEKFNEMCKTCGVKLRLDGCLIGNRSGRALEEETEPKISDSDAVAVIISDGIGRSKDAEWAVQRAHRMGRLVVGIRLSDADPPTAMANDKIIEWDAKTMINMISMR
ncbi:MAG: hypothetical protein MPI93_01950 [Nitrosopumilus sp.]|nr:hypothetical protein [Nitrosopumilus sp.]